MNSRSIRQIAATTIAEHQICVVALAEDGTLWVKTAHPGEIDRTAWRRFGDIPSGPTT
jgi:hypothetical protein